MKALLQIYVPLILAFSMISGINYLNNESQDIYGLWMREKDDLHIKIIEEKDDKNEVLSVIVKEGNDDFPCDVNSKPIYKNIVKRSDNLWTCDFLVVTINNCSSEYYPTGKMSINELGQLEIICPGFKTMYYSKPKPRFDHSN